MPSCATKSLPLIRRQPSITADHTRRTTACGLCNAAITRCASSSVRRRGGAARLRLDGFGTGLRALARRLAVLCRRRPFALAARRIARRARARWQQEAGAAASGRARHAEPRVCGRRRQQQPRRRPRRRRRIAALAGSGWLRRGRGRRIEEQLAQLARELLQVERGVARDHGALARRVPAAELRAVAVRQAGDRQ